ncbi:MAG TPA: phospholipid carrier-dependent glycosyltransferase [Candidatus Methanoperedens sp.]|nr:phospholipid carrier-dependent glycosyltransferase [Candidatus Methanoperedens sp.]
MKKFVIFLLIIGIFSRLYKVDSIPPHLSNDEISIAYDAYSIAMSGKDEHGNPYPLSFPSYGTYKAPLYTYILSPLVYIFGNTELVVRLPSIIAGLLTIVIIGLIAFELTKKRQIAMWSSALLVITPWHIYASRMAWEANLALLFLSLGIYFLMKKNLWLSSIILVISMYAYHTEWLLVPLIMFAGGIIYFGKKVWKYWLVGFVLALPLLIDYLLNAGPGARAKTEMIWSAEGANIFSILIEFIRNYAKYLNPKILFLNGLNILVKDNPFTPGLLLWPMIVPIFLGIKKIKNNFFWIWLLFSPVTAALTIGDFSLIRNLNTVVPLTILTAVGIGRINKIWWSLVLVVLINFGLIYFWHFPKELGETFQGYRPIAHFLKSVEDSTNEIFVDYRYGNYRWGLGKEYSGIPYLYLAFFQKWDPSITQNRIIKGGEIYFGKYMIGQIDWGKDIIRPNRYFVVSVGNPPEENVKDKLEQVATFDNASGKMAFEVWRGK